jgi:hypothetical protein
MAAPRAAALPGDHTLTLASWLFYAAILAGIGAVVSGVGIINAVQMAFEASALLR